MTVLAKQSWHQIRYSLFIVANLIGIYLIWNLWLVPYQFGSIPINWPHQLLPYRSWLEVLAVCVLLWMIWRAWNEIAWANGQLEWAKFYRNSPPCPPPPKFVWPAPPIPPLGRADGGTWVDHAVPRDGRSTFERMVFTGRTGPDGKMGYDIKHEPYISRFFQPDPSPEYPYGWVFDHSLPGYVPRQHDPFESPAPRPAEEREPSTVYGDNHPLSQKDRKAMGASHPMRKKQ